MLFEYSVNINLSIRSTVVICQNTSIKRGHSDFHFQRWCSNRHQIYPLAWNHQNKQTKTQNTPQSIWNCFQDNGQQTRKDQNSWETETNEKGPMFPMITDVRELPGHSEWRESPDKAGNSELRRLSWESEETKAARSHRTEYQRGKCCKELQRSADSVYWVSRWVLSSTRG